MEKTYFGVGYSGVALLPSSGCFCFGCFCFDLFPLPFSARDAAVPSSILDGASEGCSSFFFPLSFSLIEGGFGLVSCTIVVVRSCFYVVTDADEMRVRARRSTSEALLG